MNTDNKHTDNKDQFADKIREKLAFHEMQVDEDCWAEIESRLHQQKKKRILPFWWMYVGGAAVAILTLLLINPFNIPSENTANTTSQSNQESAGLHHTIGGHSPVTAKRQHMCMNTAAQQETTTALPLATTRDIAIATEGISVSSGTRQEDNTAISIHDDKQTTTDTTISKKEEKRTLPDKLIAKNEMPNEMPNEKPNSRKTNSSGWELLAQAGQHAGRSDRSQNEQFLATAANNDLNSATLGTENTFMLNENDYTTHNYYPALSVGLKIKKQMSRSLSIESGLIYSYLYSSFNKSGVISYDATLQLHYLGIPINIGYNLYNKQKWVLEISGGVMAEKGLRQIYKQDTHYSNNNYQIRNSSSIGGIQWSVNPAISLSYQLTNSVSVYIQPGYSYYFDNNQPVSIRTSSPSTITMNAGLSIRIK